MTATPSHSLIGALAAARRQTVAGARMELLADAISEPAPRAPAERWAWACRLIGEMLELDAVWLVAASADGMLASWTGTPAMPPRFSEQRLRRLVMVHRDRAWAGRDGRHAVVTAPVGGPARRVATLVGTVRSEQDLTGEDLACVRLVAAVIGCTPGVSSAAGASRGERSLDHMVLLQSLAGALGRAQSEAEVAWAVVNELRTLIDYHACRFYLLADGGDLLVPVAHRGVDAEYESDRTEDLMCAVGEGVAGHAIVDPTPRLIANARDDEWAVDVPGTEPVDESMLVAPLVIEGDPAGVLVLSHLGAGRFDGDDLRLLEVVASHAAVACHNMRLLASAREQAEVSEALLELSVALSAQQSVDDVASMAAVAADRLVESATLSVWLREGDRLRLAADHGHTPAEFGVLMMVVLV